MTSLIGLLGYTILLLEHIVRPNACRAQSSSQAHFLVGCCIVQQQCQQRMSSLVTVCCHRFSDAMKQAGMVSFEPGWDGRLGAMMRYASSASTCRRSIIARCAHRSSWRLHSPAAMPLIEEISTTLLVVRCWRVPWGHNGRCT